MRLTAFIVVMLGCVAAAAVARAAVATAGDLVVESGGSYWPARILATLDDGRLVVHYEGRSDDEDGLVRPARVHHIDAGPGGKLLVEWGGSYWPATVLQRQSDGRALIRYDGYGPEWDEVVPPSRMRTLR